MTMSGRQSADNKVIIIGGGIGGLATAISLRAIGLDVQVYERAQELKEIGAGLTIWLNAIRACEHLGLREAVLQTGVSLQMAQFRTKDGSILRVLDLSEFDFGTDLPTVVVLHRADLQRILLDAVWLARYLDSPRDTPSALRAFESHRHKRTSMIIHSSRQTGRMLHLSNPIAVSMRNLLLKYMPRSIVTRLQMQTIEDDL